VEDDINYLIKKLVNNNLQSGGQIIFASDPHFDLSSEPLDYRISNLSKDLNNIEFDVESSKDALLFLSESYNPSWKVYVNGQKVENFKANLIFQVINVANGVSHVQFIYDPLSFKIGKYVSLFTLCILVLITIYEIRQTLCRRPSQKRSS